MSNYWLQDMLRSRQREHESSGVLWSDCVIYYVHLSVFTCFVLGPIVNTGPTLLPSEHCLPGLMTNWQFAVQLTFGDCRSQHPATTPPPLLLSSSPDISTLPTSQDLRKCLFADLSPASSWPGHIFTLSQVRQFLQECEGGPTVLDSCHTIP